jgi:hypothetical protein
MRVTLLLPIVLCVALAAACSSVRTHYDFDPGTDFSAWRSYGWYPAESPRTGDPRLDNPLLHGRIEAAVDRTLAEQGYTRAADGAPDFYANYHLSTEQRLDVRTMNRSYMGGPRGAGWGGAGWGGVGWTETTVDQYEEGTLVIDFIDLPSRRLVWRGSGTRRLARRPNADQVTQRVNEAVAEVLSQFPPK